MPPVIVCLKQKWVAVCSQSISQYEIFLKWKQPNRDKWKMLLTHLEIPNHIPPIDNPIRHIDPIMPSPSSPSQIHPLNKEISRPHRQPLQTLQLLTHLIDNILSPAAQIARPARLDAAFAARESSWGRINAEGAGQVQEMAAPADTA